MYRKSEEKNEGLSLSIAIMIIGAIFFVYAVFVDTGDTSYSVSQDKNKNTYDKVYLPLFSLEKGIKKELVAVIPYVHLKGDSDSKEYIFPLRKDYDYLEAFYEIKENKNAVLEVYINDFLVSFNREGKNYYKLLEKPIFQDKDELDIRFVLNREGFSLLEPYIVIEDFVIYGYFDKSRKVISFYLNSDDIKDYNLVMDFYNCKMGSFSFKLNNCPEKIVKFDCDKKIVEKIPKICFKEENKLEFYLHSGLIELKDFYLETLS